MTTNSAPNSSCKFNKRLKTTSSRSGFVQIVQDHLQSPDDCDDRELDDHMMLVKEEMKEVSVITRNVGNNSISLKDKMGVRYKECRKNHAACIGGYAVDGCLEFMAAGEEGTAAAFKCAACSCHRNFHRKMVDENGDCQCDCSSISATTK